MFGKLERNWTILTVSTEEIDPWGAEQAMDWDVSWTHIEEWDSSKGEITRDFPGDETLAMGNKGILKYSREQEQLWSMWIFWWLFDTQNRSIVLTFRL